MLDRVWLSKRLHRFPRRTIRQESLRPAASTSIGERAEDVFHVTDDRGQPLGEEARHRLQEKLTEALDRRDAPTLA